MKNNRKKYVLLFIGLLIIVTIIQCLIFFPMALEKRNNKKQEAYSYGQNLADAIKLTLENCVDSSESLKYFYSTYGEDCFEKFDEIAEQIYQDNNAIGSMYIAPKAVIQVAYPKEVNESTIGFEMLKDPKQGPRAQLAIDTRKVTVAGPHNLVEGGKGLIIRNPLFKNDEFIGFSIVVLDWDRFVDQILENTSNVDNHYKFAVWKEDYDQTAVQNEDGYFLKNTDESISKEVDIEFSVPNDKWHLVVEPVSGWKVVNDITLQIVVSIIVSLFFVASSMYLYYLEQKKLILSEEVKRSKEKLPVYFKQ